MNLRTRVAVAAGVGVLIVLAIVSTVLYLFYAASLRSRVDPSLVDAAQQTTKIAQQVKQAASDKGAPADTSRPVTVGSIDVQLFVGPVASGQPTRYGHLDSTDVAVAEHAAPAYFATRSVSGTTYRVYTAALPDSSSGALVQTSRATSADDGALRRAALLLATLTVAASAITFLVARLTARRLLRPVADLTAATEHVTRTGDLRARLGPGGNDEVGRLRASFDAMLAALDESVTAQAQLVADASHELRTPLTSLTTNLDLLEDGAGLADPEAPALVRAAREQAADLDALVHDLLDLARYGESVHREDVRLDARVALTVERVQARAPHARIETTLTPCWVRVDPDALDRAVGNLIDNAIKWSPPGSAVSVCAANGRVEVTDRGPGVADADAPHVFERFYRSATARGMPGAGLGLAIVGRVAQANGGTVGLRTGPGGSTFTLAFPPLPYDVSAGRDGSAPHCDHEPV